MSGRAFPSSQKWKGLNFGCKKNCKLGDFFFVSELSLSLPAGFSVMPDCDEGEKIYEGMKNRTLFFFSFSTGTHISLYACFRKTTLIQPFLGDFIEQFTSRIWHKNTSQKLLTLKQPKSKRFFLQPLIASHHHLQTSRGFFFFF